MSKIILDYNEKTGKVNVSTEGEFTVGTAVNLMYQTAKSLLPIAQSDPSKPFVTEDKQ